MDFHIDTYIDEKTPTFIWTFQKISCKRIGAYNNRLTDAERGREVVLEDYLGTRCFV